MSAEAGVPHELVIIKRRGHAEEDAHHGGVWKIAYADFMTAMMAFFLVMWLINAANEETRSQVASYFNPVKLVDSRTASKGLQELDAGVAAKVKHEQFKGANPKSQAEGGGGEGVSDKEPEKAAHGQAAGPAQEHGASGYSESGPQAEAASKAGRLGGEAFLDPFDPQAWEKIAAEQSEAAAAEPPQEAAADKASSPENDGSENATGVAVAKDQAAAAAQAEADAGQKLADSEVMPKPADGGDLELEARKIEQEIKAAMERAAPGATPGLEVRGTEQGVLISLTDNISFGMFDIASDRPKPEVVRFMRQIAKILEARTGTIIVSGHTDSRPFRSPTYDNWKLSSARAQMAYYMLVEGGVDEKRFERVEGHADRALKVPGDPDAAQNRRIEILLREAKP